MPVLHLEALIALTVFLVVVSFCFQAAGDLQASTRLQLDPFKARLAASSFAFLVDSLYLNAASHSLDLNLACRKAEERVDCLSGSSLAEAELVNRPEILTADSRVRGNGHYD